MFRTKAERKIVRWAMAWAVYLSFLGNMVAAGYHGSLWLALFWFNVVSAILFVLFLVGVALWRWSDKWINEGE